MLRQRLTHNFTLSLATGLWLACASVLGSVIAPMAAQAEDSVVGTIIEGIRVEGNQRIEPETVISYLRVRVGDPYEPSTVDASLKNLFATGLFADVLIRMDQTILLVIVRENPIINRLTFEGNDKVENEDLAEEVQMRPRTIFTRAKVQADVQRIVELYRRQGRFAATVEPKIIELPQNRVNLIFEISEGKKTKVRRINFIGNRKYDDGDLRDEIATRETRWWRFLTSNDTFDPDRLLYDREVLRQFYLSKGYADFRIISAVAELTRDRQDFFITFVVEEGERYRTGEVAVESQIKDLDPERLEKLVLNRTGKWYNAKEVEDTVDLMTDEAGEEGYAFVNVRPRLQRDRENLVMNITYRVLDAPRVYVEKVEITGNVRTLDKVIRREFRLIEGDAFNTSRLRRSRIRVRALGYFEEVEIEQSEGSSPDRTILTATVQEQSTGELSIGAGVSSFESVIGEFSIRERNLLGRGQDVRLAVSISGRRQQVDIGFTEPRFLNRNLAAGIDLFHRQYEFRESDFRQRSTGGGVRFAWPLTEYLTMGTRYTIRVDDLNSDFVESIFIVEGTRLTSSVGVTFSFDTRDDARKPTKGFLVVLSEDVAGLGGNVRYSRVRLNADWYTPIPFAKKWVLNLSFEGGHIFGFGQPVEINERFFVGGTRMRGFDQAGIGPRLAFVSEETRDENIPDVLVPDPQNSALGGNTMLIASAEVFVPLGPLEEFGIEASLFFDVGTLFGVNNLNDPDTPVVIPDIRGVLGTDMSIRMSVGVGFSWNSPFGPIRFDFAKALKKEPWDDSQFFQFNIGTRF